MATSSADNDGCSRGVVPAHPCETGMNERNSGHFMGAGAQLAVLVELVWRLERQRSREDRIDAIDRSPFMALRGGEHQRIRRERPAYTLLLERPETKQYGN